MKSTRESETVAGQSYALRGHVSAAESVTALVGLRYVHEDMSTHSFGQFTGYLTCSVASLNAFSLFPFPHPWTLYRDSIPVPSSAQAPSEKQ